MIAAGKRELQHAGFGGEYDNPTVDFGETVTRIFSAMLATSRRPPTEHPPAEQ
jgi:hypothetical protein